MGIVKTKAIILKESNMGDFDKMLTMLTPDFGKISCVAKSARRPSSTLLAGTQFLSFGEYVLYKGSGGTYHINSCEPIEVFYNLRTDLDKLQYAAYITKIVEDVTNENDSSYNILQLLLNTIYTISETNMNKELILAIFKIRLTSLLGFTPDINKCVNCGDKEKLICFSIKDNGLKCETCAKIDKSVIRISESTLYAIKYIILAPAKKLFSFNIPSDSVEELRLIAKIYLEEKLEKTYKFDKIF